MGLTLSSPVAIDATYYGQKARAEKMIGRSMGNAEFERDYYEPAYSNGGLSDTGTSVFSPCLCEMDYMWFTNAGDSILDPFAGGSVRGIVAEKMGRKYTGIELRREQVEENIRQGGAICNECPEWICGDSLMMDELLGDRQFDHVFTCPPYGNLEVYSDDAADLSAMSNDDFDSAYAEVVRAAASHLRDDRFATVVVGNYRDDKGMLRDLSGLTVKAMESAGLRYYNDMVYVTPVGTLPIRVPRMFNASRKVGRTHQYVLNFVKGNAKNAVDRLGGIVIPDIDIISE